MKYHWHPLSTVLMPEFGAFASPAMVRMMLSAGPVTIRYAGDRMWPAVGHGAELQVKRIEPGDGWTPGSLLLVNTGGVIDLLRLQGVDAAGKPWVNADADPADPRTVGRDDVLGRVMNGRPASPWPAWSRRLALELAEAWRGRPGSDAGSVRRKYDAQAPYYAGALQELDRGLAERLARHAPDRGKVLVAGSGAGGECFGLAADGWEVRGIDFSAAMVEQARRLATERSSLVEFLQGDLLTHCEEAGSLQSILFTYDVYSFLPVRAERVALLRRMGRWLVPGGSILLSARLAGTAWSRAVLTLQWLGRGAPGFDRWGGSHTRYIDPDGTLHRSFVHYFSQRGLRGEIREAGLIPGALRAGHLRAVPDGPRKEKTKGTP